MFAIATEEFIVHNINKRGIISYFMEKSGSTKAMD